MKKIILSLLSLVLIYIFLFNFLTKIELKKSNSNFINNLLHSSNYYFCKDNNTSYLFNFINIINNIQLDRPVTIVEKNFYKASNDYLEFGYIQNNVIDKPQVYIYSTHYNESYIDGVKITDASYLLQSELNKLDVMTIVSERSVEDYIKNNSLQYKDSYKATRTFLQDILKQYPDLDLIIDLHRDATSKQNSTAFIDNTNYAKVMFVMNENYPNLKLAEKLDNILVSNLNISRGVYHKKVDNFNQDLNENVVLIEMGANYNTFEEVKNSIPILANSIKELLDEKR